MESIPGDYQFNAINYGRPAQRFWHSAKIRLLDHLQVAQPSQTALDAGCGSGVVSHYLAGKCDKVVGIDVSQEAVEFATSKFGSSKLSFCKANLQSASSVGSFDLVVVLKFWSILNLPKYKVSSVNFSLRQIMAQNCASRCPIPEAFGLSLSGFLTHST